MAHKFRLQQRVRFAQVSKGDALNRSDVYEVSRLLPADGNGELTYRIKSHSAERAVRESEITLLA